jgi:hypothetical protein
MDAIQRLQAVYSDKYSAEARVKELEARVKDLENKLKIEKEKNEKN